MAKLYIVTERMKKAFARFNATEEFTQETLAYMAGELIYFAEYAEKNKIKTMYDLEEKMNLPFEAYLDGFEQDVLASEDLDYSPVLACYKKLLNTFSDAFFFEMDTIRIITNMYFRVGDCETAEAFMNGFMENSQDANGYYELIHGFLSIDNVEKAKQYYDIAEAKELENKEVLDEFEF